MGDRSVLETQQPCPECGGSPTRSNGETVCDGCGLVLVEHRTTSTPSPSNEGGSSESNLLPTKGLTTKIDARPPTAAPSTRSSGRRKRLRKWQHRIRQNNSRERNLDTALAEINRISSALGIPDVTRETASILYQRALDDDLIVGWSIETIATASVHIACRKEGLPKSLDDVAAVATVQERKIGRARRHLARELRLSIPPQTPRDYLPRYCSELSLDQDVENRARRVLNAAEDAEVSGRSPSGLAGAAVYLAAQAESDPIDQEEAASVADVAVNTISRHSQDLADTQTD